MLLAMFELSNVLPAVWHREHPVSMHLIVEELAQVCAAIICQLQLTLPMSVPIFEFSRVFVTIIVFKLA